jgi:hypothetical protein
VLTVASSTAFGADDLYAARVYSRIYVVGAVLQLVFIRAWRACHGSGKTKPPSRQRRRREHRRRGLLCLGANPLPAALCLLRPGVRNRDELAVSCGFRRLGEDHPSEFRAMGRKMELAKSSSSIAPEIECRPNVSDVSLRSRHVPAQAPVNARVLGAVVRVRRRRAVVGT